MTDTYEPTPDEKRIVAWLMQEPSPASWPHWKDDTGDVYRDLTAGFIADAIERGEHRGDTT